MHHPYNMDNPVKMVGHDLIFIQYDIFKMAWQFSPMIIDYFTEQIQHHFIVHNDPKQHFPVLGYNRHKIPSRLGIIISF